jgi:hypothetical protein
MDSLVSRKPHNASEEEKKKRKLKKKSKQTITRAVTHIRLLEANAGKLSTLDALMSVYLELCQQYTTLFCQAESKPDKWSEPVLETQLSERLHRVALQQAAGIAQSFRTNRTSAYQTYRQDVAAYEAAKAQAEAEGRMATFKRREPSWTEWKLPVLRVPVMQANANVVVVEPSTDSTFDYWLRISTLDKGHPLRVPVKLAAYHKKALAGKTLNTSTTLSRRKGAWWLTLSFDEELPLRTEAAAPVVGVDVGIANFVTTSTGQSYGTFHGALARKHRRDRRKRRTKAKLRACLEKKGVPQAQLPSTSSATGQRRGSARASGDQSSHQPGARGAPGGSHRVREPLGGLHALSRTLHECLPVCLPAGPYPKAVGLGSGQAGDGGSHRQPGVQLAGMSPLPFRLPRQPAGSEDLPLCRVRLPGPC